MKLLLCLLLFVACNGSSSNAATSVPTPSAEQRAAVEKIRGELNDALEAGEEEQDGVIVQPSWTKTGHKSSAVASKVVVNQAALQTAKTLRTEINRAVNQQGDTEEVRQLEAVIKAKNDDTAKQSVLGSVHQQEPLLGSGAAAEDTDDGATDESTINQANIVDAAPLDIDLAQLQQLELSKRRTREMLILGRIEEQQEFDLGENVSRWLQLQHNGSVYFVGQRNEELLLVQQQQQEQQEQQQPQLVPDHIYKTLQILPIQGRINAMLSFERWNPNQQQQQSLVLLCVDQELLWYRLVAMEGLQQFWRWPLANVNKVLTFVAENREYLVVTSNRTLSIYAHNVDSLEFWIVQRMQLLEEITAIAVLDTGRDLLLAVGQRNEAIVYSHDMHELAPDAGLQLQQRQRLEAPQIADIAAFQMGGRSYLALGGQRPQILAYVQGQLQPKTVLGQNFGVVELFLPVPVRSYRDDLLLLVQHRVYFDTHSLVQLEVLIWNGEAFEASLPPPCVLGSQLMRYGAVCMLDELRDQGLAGAALLRQVQPPLLIVPRHEAPSGLFRLHTQLLPRNSELHDIQEIEEFMRNWVQEQDKVLQLANQLLQAVSEAQEIQDDELNTSVVILEGGTVDALYVNEVPWTVEDSGIDLYELLQEIRMLKQQLLDVQHGQIRGKRQSPLFHYDYEQLDFDVLDVGDLIIDKLNHVPFYIQNATLQFNGTINVQHLQLLQPPQFSVPPESLPSSTRQQLQLSGNLSCHFINGLDWKSFQEDLIWRYETLQLSQLQVQGAVVFEDSLHLSALNELSFPDDYLWSQGSSTSIVRAPKQFVHTLTVNDVDTAGRINGRDPLDAITLSDAQDWPGLVTFTQLEVSEELQLNGNAQGRRFEEAPLNPTLLETKHIHAACHFAELVVNGALQVQGLLDGNSFDALLGDLVQRSADGNQELIIPGVKHVTQLNLPVDAHVLDGKVGGIAIEHFVTKHTEQTLHKVHSLAGYVYFHQLQLSGSFDGVHVQQLLDQTLRVDAPLKAPTTRLQFAQELQVPQLQVLRLLNDMPLAGYQTLHEPLHLSWASFERLQAKNLDVAYNVLGEGRLNNRLVSELLNMPRQADHVQVQELILPMGVQARRLQGLDAKLLLDFLQQLDMLPLHILHGQLQVEHIAINGAVQVESTLNGRNFAQLQREVVWLDQPNDLRTRWRFQVPPIFDSDLVLQGSYNQRLLPELLQDIVFRDEQQQEQIIVGTKNFIGPVIVRQSLQLEALNGVPFNKLANKLQPIHLAGDLHLTGELHATNVQLTGELNGEAIGQLEQQLRWQPELNSFVQLGELQLPQMQLKDLTVFGHLGNRSQETLHEFFGNVFLKNEKHLQLDGHKIFTGRVGIQGGANITTLNGIQVKQLLEQLILLDGSAEQPITIHTPVHFEAPVQMQQLDVEQLKLPGGRLNGCNITEWIYDTIRVDQNWRAESVVSFASGALDNNALQVEQLNHLNLSQLVTLHTQQQLSYPLVAKELQLLDGQVLFDGLVKGIDLLNEYTNTLLLTSPHVQHVTTPLVMQSVYVTGSLLTNGTINADRHFNLSDVATVREEQLQLQTPVYFEVLHAPELRTEFRINGFDYNAWHEKSLWAKGRQTQLITGNWSVYWLRVKQPHEAEQAAHAVYRRQTTALMERQRGLCRRLARLFGLLHLPYQLKQLRYGFELNQDQAQPDLRRVFALKSAVKGTNYLLLNEIGCWTRLYRWNGTHFANAGSIESGPIDDVTVLQLRNESRSGNKHDTNEQFTFMTSYELTEEHLERSWNCSSLNNLQSWRTSDHIELTEPLGVPLASLEQLQQQHEAKQLQRRGPRYQQAIKYLNRPSIKSQLSPRLNEADGSISREQFETLQTRLLDHLSFRLHTEVNITQLSIPETDLYDDEHLVEDFVWLMGQLRGHALKSGSQMFATLPTDTLPLPNNPARVLAARSCHLIWPVLEELKVLYARLAIKGNQTALEQEQQQQLQLQLEQTVHDVLQLAYMGSTLATPDVDDDTLRLHAVIERLRQLQWDLQTDQQVEESIVYTKSLPATQLQQRVEHLLPVQTIRLLVGPAQRSRLLYARLTIVASDAPSVAPSSAPAAHIQLHYANGTLFQSLAADQRARQLTALRVLDETLLAFVEDCCQVRVFIYRGIEGFVPFAEFQTEANNEVLQLLALRLPLLQSPGALYSLAVVQTRRIIFYKLVIPGLFESWLHC